MEYLIIVGNLTNELVEYLILAVNFTSEILGYLILAVNLTNEILELQVLSTPVFPFSNYPASIKYSSISLVKFTSSMK